MRARPCSTGTSILGTDGAGHREFAAHIPAENDEFSRLRVHAGQRRDVHLVRHQNQGRVQFLSRDPLAQHARLRLTAFVVTKERIQHRLLGDRPQSKQARRFQTSAPLAGEHRRDRHPAFPESDANAARLLPPLVRQVSLGVTIIDCEIGRISRPRCHCVAQ